MGMLPLKPELKRVGPWIPEEQKFPTPFRKVSCDTEDVMEVTLDTLRDQWDV